MTELENIKKNINDIWGVDIADKNRRIKSVVARTVYCYIARKQQYYSYSQIGKVINRDHATVIHAVRRFEKINQYPEFKSVINRTLALYEIKTLDDVSVNYQGMRHSIIQLQNRIKKISGGIDPIFLELNSLPADKLKDFKENRAKPFLKMHQGA